MRFSALAVAVAALSGPTIANPIEGRAASPDWSITKFSFCRGDSSYKYSFNVQGGADAHTPAFFGTCIGTNGHVYLQCTSNPTGDQNFNLFAKTKIINGVPRVKIETWYIANGCRYTRDGSYTNSDATCASKKGNKFTITPTDSTTCN